MSAASKLCFSPNDSIAGSDHADVRRLPILRIREHLQISSNWVPVLNELMSARLEKNELAVLLTIMFLRPRQHLNNRELRALVGITYRRLSEALASLVKRRILFFDVWHYSEDEEKNIWHLASPFHWQIEGWKSGLYAKGDSNPEEWVPRHLYSSPEDRIDEYSEVARQSGSYIKAPRILGTIDLTNHAKRIWLYLSSLKDTWHPTANQISMAVGVSKPTTLGCLALMESSDMIVHRDYRHARYRPQLERTYHLVHPAFWTFDNASVYQIPEFSIVQAPESIKYIAEGKKQKPRGSNIETKRVKNRNQDGKKWKPRR